MKGSGRMFIRKSKRTARIVIAALLLTMTAWLMPGDLAAAQADAAVKLQNPVIVEDASMESGQKVTWDCIYFGSYPQREVIADEAAYDSLFRGNDTVKGYYNKDTDVIEDPALVDKLETAKDWERNIDITIDGSRYRRMTKTEATSYDEDYTDIQRYNWKNADSCHYFKYEPIKWRVLDVNGSDVLLMADKALDNQWYNRNWSSITWEKSTIRSWLNGYGSSENTMGRDYTDCEDDDNSNFIDSAFTPDQKNAIKTADVVNSDSLYCGTDGGNDTQDKVFLLSDAEVYDTDTAASYGFVKGKDTHDEGRMSKSSTYAKAMGARSETNETDDTYSGNCMWWLRTPGDKAYSAADIGADGAFDFDDDDHSAGIYVSTNWVAVRPVLHLDLSASDDWEYFGTVCSDGTETAKTVVDVVDFGKCKASLSTTKYTYNGKVKKPNVTVTYEDSTLEKGTDYTVSYTGSRKNVGKYKVVVKGAGDFEGTKTLYFTISPKSTSLSKLTAAKKGFTAKWKKQATQTSGYQIMYATNSCISSIAA